jgi:hypothetical protein
LPEVYIEIASLSLDDMKNMRMREGHSKRVPQLRDAANRTMAVFANELYT